jgi:hypothetical protein
MKLMLTRTFNGLKATYNTDLELLSKLEVGQSYLAEIKKPRNILFHRKFFALLNLLFDNQDVHDDIDELRSDLLINIGCYKEKPNLDGEVIKIPLSISFSKMDEVEFSKMYEKSKTFIMKYLKITNEQISEQIEQYF